MVKFFLMVLAVPLFSQELVYLDNISPDHPQIRYKETGPKDPVSSFIERVQSRQISLRAGSDSFGYLPDLLNKLGVSTDSQVLVFSRTSLQAHKISPSNPRAIYFNENIAVGWIPGAQFIEVIAQDPEQGAIFYTLDAQKNPPVFQRQFHCLSCHQGPATLGVPGPFVGSVFPAASGKPFKEGAIITDHRTSFSDRWGGWYVTAKNGQQKDRSNAFWLDSSDLSATGQPLNSLGTVNQPQLPRQIKRDQYLSPSSDIVALLILEHQTRVANLLTRLHWETRLGQNTEARIQETIDALLFHDEAHLVEPIEGTSSFAQTFSHSGFRDQKGRSLKDFDLNQRVFRYPLSYMLESRQFATLPFPVKNIIHQKLMGIVARPDGNDRFQQLKSEDRKVLQELLQERSKIFQKN